MARLVGTTSSLGFASWTIFDFPVMTRLQRWYLEQTLDRDKYDVVQNLDSQTEAEREGRGLVRLVDTHNLWNHLAELDAATEIMNAGDGKAGEWDVLIASHSWASCPSILLGCTSRHLGAAIDICCTAHRLSGRAKRR